jgi:hypothetical protein
VTVRILSVLLLLAMGSVACAQWGLSYGHASTVEEGAQRGYADIVRSRDMANLLNSEAAKNYEDVRREYLENRMRATQTYFEMRRYNQEARRAERSTPLSMEQYVRIARDQAPDRLTTTQLDPLTGALNWPLPLRKPEYEDYRQRIERLFADRAAGFVVYGEINDVVAEFQAQVKADIETFPPNDYIDATKFLGSLRYESTLAQR